MISFSLTDIIIIALFFLTVILIGFIPGKSDDQESYLLSGRKLGLFLFVLTNVATWYGGILGIGEFTYSYGILSWVTQGLPYYIFAILFALFFAGKIRKASLFTIPDKLEEKYGRNAGIISSAIIFFLVSPAPYLLMLGTLIAEIFGVSKIIALIAGVFISVIYLFRGGYKSDIYTDVFQFFVMFAGFIILLVSVWSNTGGYEFLENNLPATHLQFTGGTGWLYILVWFFIALWTFTDPGFHQRCYAAKDSKTAVKGIIISVFFWALFDFLTTSTGLYSRAVLPNVENPSLAFPLLAEHTLSPGLKGIFYAALFATIISTLNSFLFLSATTFSRDLIMKISGNRDESKIVKNSRLGLFVSSAIAVVIAYYVDSIIEIWYLTGSICIPGIIFLIAGAYYEKLRIPEKFVLPEIIIPVLMSIVWIFFRENILAEVEPMIIGMFTALIIHTSGIIYKKRIIKK